MTLTFLVIVSSVIFTGGSGEGSGVDLASLERWEIVVSKTATITDQYAAKELRDVLKQACDVTLPIVTEVSRSDHHFFIGAGEAMQTSAVGFSTDDFSDEDLRIVIKETNIAIAGGRPRGTLYGVYKFLEDYLGVRYLTFDHTHVPHVAPRHVVGPIDVRYNPPLKFRWTFYRETNENPPFATRMRINTVGTGCTESVSSDPKLGGKTPIRLVNHSFFDQVSSLKYGEEHPEYYCMRDGRRWLESPTDHRAQDRQNQPCMTNADVLKIVTRETLAECESLTDYNTVSVSQNDNDQYCQCPSCEAINTREGSPMGSLLAFVNSVADAAAAEHPHREIGTLAYQYSRKPPKTLRPRSNVRVQLCSIECCVIHALDDPTCPLNAVFMRDLNGWSNLAERLSIWHYQVNFSDYTLIYPSLRWIDHNVRIFVSHNVEGIFMQAAGETVGAAFSDLYNYVISAVLWDPSREAGELTAEFIRLHYGPAAEPIQRFVDLVHDKALASDRHSRCFGRASRFFLDDLGTAEAGLDAFEEALALSDTPDLHHRVEKASIAALRLALEPAFVTMKTGDPLNDGETERLRPLAQRYLRLCAKNNVRTIKSDGTNIDWAAHGLGKVLDLYKIRP